MMLIEYPHAMPNQYLEPQLQMEYIYKFIITIYCNKYILSNGMTTPHLFKYSEQHGHFLYAYIIKSHKHKKMGIQSKKIILSNK